MVIVETDSDSADDEIVNLAQEEILPSLDIPLIDRLAEKGVLVLDDRGNIFTKENIKEIIYKKCND